VNSPAGSGAEPPSVEIEFSAVCWPCELLYRALIYLTILSGIPHLLKSNQSDDDSAEWMKGSTQIDIRSDVDSLAIDVHHTIIHGTTIFTAAPLENWRRPPGRRSTTWMKTAAPKNPVTSHWSNRCGSESSTLETDVYIWHYALLVVHAKKEEEGKSKLVTISVLYWKTATNGASTHWPQCILNVIICEDIQ